MAWLLKIREQVFRFTRRFELYVMAGIRFVIALIAFTLINTNIGFNETASSSFVPLVLALICAFLPSSVSVFVGAALIIIQFYTLSEELAVISLCLFLVMFFVYYRFVSRKGMYTMLTPVLTYFRLPFVMPVATGLVDEPVHVISTICGEVVFFLVKNVHEKSLLFSDTNPSFNGSELTLVARQIFGNPEMYLYLIAFIAATIVVYLIRITGKSHCREIAVLVGSAIQIVIVGVGELYMGNIRTAVYVTIGAVVSGLISYIVAVFTMSLDYRLTEHLVYEDDHYSYYVKAVPKTFVAVAEKQVTTITGSDSQVEEATPEDSGEEENVEEVSVEDQPSEASAVIADEEGAQEAKLNEAELATAEKIFENALRENIDLDQIAEHVGSKRSGVGEEHLEDQ